MGLRDDLQTDLAEAFDDADGLADAVRSFSGSREVQGSYDPATGTTTTTTVAYSGRGVFSGYSIEEIDGQHVLREDVRLTILQNEITLDSDGSPATPQIDDTLDGKAVINVGKDPADAAYTVQLRDV